MLAWLAFLAALGFRLAQHWAAPPFSPDSWSYWELAQSVGHDFYRIHTWRQFRFEAPYGVSFPPLWPIVIAATDALTGAGHRSGIVANLAIALATAAALQAFARRAFGHALPGLALMLALVAHRSWFEEVFAGRSMPLSLLLLIALLLQLLAAVRARENAVDPHAGAGWAWRVPLLASTAALATLNRFDYLPALLVLGIAVPLLLQPYPAAPAPAPTPAARARAIAGPLALWWATAALWLAPWAHYGRTHFGRAFVSDNTRTVLSAVPVNVDDFYVVPPPTLFDAPAAWVWKTLDGAGAVALKLLQPMAANLPLLVLLAAAVLAWRARHHAATLVPSGWHTAFGPRLVWLVGDLAVAAQTASVLLAGFASIRYALPLEVYVCLRLGAFARAQGADLSRATLPLFVAAALQCGLLFEPHLTRWLNPVREADGLHTHDALAACMRREHAPRLLFLTEDAEHAYRFGARYGIDTLSTPDNYRTADLAALVRRFGATHVYDALTTPPRLDLRARLHARLTPVCGREDVFRLGIH